MFKFINSLRASSSHMKAINHWARFNRSDAWGEISKAVYLETNNKYLVKHLVFKGEIEYEIGKLKESKKSLNRAKELIDIEPKYWEKSSNKDILISLQEAIEKNEYQKDQGGFREHALFFERPKKRLSSKPLS